MTKYISNGSWVERDFHECRLLIEELGAEALPEGVRNLLDGDWCFDENGDLKMETVVGIAVRVLGHSIDTSKMSIARRKQITRTLTEVLYGKGSEFVKKCCKDIKSAKSKRKPFRDHTKRMKEHRAHIKRLSKEFSK